MDKILAIIGSLFLFVIVRRGTQHFLITGTALVSEITVDGLSLALAVVVLVAIIGALGYTKRG